MSSTSELDFSWLESLKVDELRDLTRLVTAIEKRHLMAGPMDDDTLHAWVLKHLKVDIPRAAVCEGHDAPFKFLADLYFERVLAAIAMANRGGAKTFLCAVLHVLNGKFRPGVEMASVGAIEAQAQRAYAHVQKLLAVEGGVALADDNPDIVTSIMSKTRWKNGSFLEVLGGSINAVNGPHPQKVHFDEVELADPEVFDESRNMSQTANGYAAQDFITSTRKRAHGPMQRLIDDCDEAERVGREPPYKLYSWCIFETAKNVPNCRVAHGELPEAKKCDCHLIVKGTWDDGTERRFDQVCKGRLSRSAGWIPLTDLHKTFRLDTREIWEAQQECVRPSLAGLVLPTFSRESRGIRRFDPDPDNGAIYMGVDFGGTNPFAVHWYQQLRYEVDVTDYHGNRRRIKEGSIVCFDELYTPGGNDMVYSLIVDRERKWKRVHRNFTVRRRFPDPQGAAVRKDWAAKVPPIRTTFVATRDPKQHIIKIRELLEDDLFFVDVGRCPNFCNEAEAWHYPKKRPGMMDDPEIPVNDNDHAMANFRYTVANIFQLKRVAGRRRGATPRSGDRRHGTANIVRDAREAMPNMPRSRRTVR